MLLNHTPCYIGTAGYSYEDWKGSFYPEAMEKPNFLDYYVNSGFNFLELTYTFYKVPFMARIEEVLKKTDMKVDFSIKLTKELLRYDVPQEQFDEFLRTISPIIEEKKLITLVADFKPDYANKIKNFEAILKLKDSLGDIPLTVELLHPTWYKEKMMDLFKKNDITLVTLDVPKKRSFPPYMPTCHNGIVYFKLYGQHKFWINPEDKITDYSYNEASMSKFITDAVDKSIFAKKIIFSFANAVNGHAPVNALTFKNNIIENQSLFNT